MNKINELKIWYEKLTLSSLENLDYFYEKNLFFKDPFNEVDNIDGLKNIFKHMFKTLEHPRFVFIDTLEKDDESFLTWDFIFQFKGIEYKIHGSSHIKFTHENMIYYHRDYWDVGEELLLKIPVINYFYKRFRKGLSCSKK
jgi:hypothetical protein